MRKKIFTVIISSILLVCVGLAMTGCTETDKKYFEKVSKYSFWENEGSQSIAQYKYYNIMTDFLNGGTIEDGQYKKDGKVRKVAFIGWDGARADSLLNILRDTNDFKNNSYADTADFSGLNELNKTGGTYLAYCGGEKGKSSAQDTSTSASWTSEFTGVWSETHGVIDNNHTKNFANKTIFLDYALQGLQTSLAFDWGTYFDVALKDEVKYLMQNPNVELSYRDLDRAIANSVDEAKKNEKLKAKDKLVAESLELHNFVASTKVAGNAPYDTDMRDYMIERISSGVDDIVGGIFHNPDSNGHTDGFGNGNGSYVNSVRNADNYLYQIIQTIKEREANNNEEWLILVANDHGGSGTGHGKQVYEHRTNWVASNRKIDTKYYGVGYDGFKENK